MMDIQSLQAHSSSDLEQKDQRIEDLLRVCLLTIYYFWGIAVAQLVELLSLLFTSIIPTISYWAA